MQEKPHSDMCFCENCKGITEHNWIYAVKNSFSWSFTDVSYFAIQKEIAQGKKDKENFNLPGDKIDSIRISLKSLMSKLDVIYIGTCKRCNTHFQIWCRDNKIYPEELYLKPTNDMSINVKKIYLEANGIYQKSPRGAAALLRLAIQELCIELGEKGKNINEDIASLVKKGLDSTVQKSLDYVRVIGNNAVHPGQIDTDDVSIAKTLFKLINMIIKEMITRPKEIDGIYDSLPSKNIQSIKDRDN